MKTKNCGLQRIYHSWSEFMVCCLKRTKELFWLTVYSVSLLEYVFMLWSFMINLQWHSCRWATEVWLLSFVYCVYFGWHLINNNNAVWQEASIVSHLWFQNHENDVKMLRVVVFFRWITFCSEPATVPLLPSVVLDSTVWSCNCFSFPDRALALSRCSCCFGPVWVKIAPESIWAECTTM